MKSKNEIKWISYDEAETKTEIGVGGCGGWFSPGMRWNDYLEIWNEDARPLVELLRASIIKNKIKVGGDAHQNGENEYAPMWPNGEVATFSYRAWGDLMAAVWSTEEDKDYGYFDFYMQCYID